MKRRDMIKAAVATVAAGWCWLGETSRLLAAPDNAAYARCAKACRDCTKACQACAKHCAEMVKSGMKEHEAMQHLTEDCMDVCALCAKLCTRKSPLAVAMAEACRKACAACGKECERSRDMKVMADCARACEDCDKSCQELIAAA